MGVENKVSRRKRKRLQMNFEREKNRVLTIKLAKTKFSKSALS